MTEEQDAQPTSLANEGAYEVIRQRLTGLGEQLQSRLHTLNKNRVTVFGSTQMSVIGRTRVRTENNCVPRDIIDVGNHLLFGYNVFVGMKSEVKIEDVFSLYHVNETDEGIELHTLPFKDTAFDDSQFKKDFHELYRYYKDASLNQIRNVAGKKLAVFQTGNTLKDIKVFRWAVDSQQTLSYLDNRGEKENIYPTSHDFDWIATTRDNHVAGKHPHISILDEVFVETINGDLTIKVENNTEDGLGIYQEPVEDQNQSLADSQIYYAKLGAVILLKIRPYKESQWRYLVFNTLNQQVDRIDALDTACVRLPEDHGFIFAGGYYLQIGEKKFFEAEGIAHMTFKRMLRSPNGEDVLYVFHDEAAGKMVLYSYNLIRKEVQNPIICHGYSIFADGRMIEFHAKDDTPTRVHAMRIWQTPYVDDDYINPNEDSNSFLTKIGNAELVRGIAEAYSVKRLLDEQQPTLLAYEHLIAQVNRIIDAFYWWDHEEIGNIQPIFKDILSTAELILDEFEKVQALQKTAHDALTEAQTIQNELIFHVNKHENWTDIQTFIDSLSRLRQQRGHLITLKDMRYSEVAVLDELEIQCREKFDELSQHTVHFLLENDALADYRQQIENYLTNIPQLAKVSELIQLSEEVSHTTESLDLLNQVVQELQIEDSTERTRILEAISEVYAQLNRTKAELEHQRQQLSSGEARAEFSAQFKLFTQSITTAMNSATTPDKVDEQLSRLMVQLEELESRFAEYDEFLLQITDKREEVYNNLDARKQQLIEANQRRALNLSQAAERILQGIRRRAGQLKSSDEQNAFFAADSMVLKVQSLVEELHELGDSVKAEDVLAQLKSSRDQAQRELRDQQDIFSDDGQGIHLGKHVFSVNKQTLDVSLLPKIQDDGQAVMMLHVTGTDFFMPMTHEGLEQSRTYWQQNLVSENETVYRSAYLAVEMLEQADQKRLYNALLAPDELLAYVREFSANRFDEGYERGVHDNDTVLILQQLLTLYRDAELLRFSPACRALGQFFWVLYTDQAQCRIWERSARSIKQIHHTFEHEEQVFSQHIINELAEVIEAFAESMQVTFITTTYQAVATYVFSEIQKKPTSFTLSHAAIKINEGFLHDLEHHDKRRDFEEDLRALNGQLAQQIHLVYAWLTAYGSTQPEINNHYFYEVVMILLVGRKLKQASNATQTQLIVKGLAGQHPRIRERGFSTPLDIFLQEINTFRETDIPAFTAYRQLRKQLLEEARQNLRLEELIARPLTSFVRNRLINEVYLPIIGDNFAKQMGALGDSKRTDLMGMLLLISPPGYGKTTLIEYIAQRLGLIFVKINCPTIGHQVISLDPKEAPNETARQELEKLNFALAMGNNVLLYLDDIQHTNPEFLQKFITLADGQRRIEGILQGRAQTFDLRGKRFAIAMAGNPYTESGEAFKIPDMLTNRADIYNLGDMLQGKEAVFALSYIENAITSHPVLAPLATRDPEDIYKIIRLAQGEEIASTELNHPYSSAELNEMVQILEKLLVIQSIILEVNQQYIYSAAQDDAYRVEPAFKLQGSYRNMNKMTEKVIAVMNEEELQALITDHYQGEAQTLTIGAEENLLKLAEIRGTLTTEEAARWEEIKQTYGRLQRMGGDEEDPVNRVVQQLAYLGQQLTAIDKGVQTLSNSQEITQSMAQLTQSVKALPNALVQASPEKSPSAMPTTVAASPQAPPPTEVHVINETSEQFLSTLGKMVSIIDETLLPVVHDFERRSRLDLVIWNRLKEVSDTLKEIDSQAFMKAKKRR